MCVFSAKEASRSISEATISTCEFNPCPKSHFHRPNMVYSSDSEMMKTYDFCVSPAATDSQPISDLDRSDSSESKRGQLARGIRSLSESMVNTTLCDSVSKSVYPER